MNEVERIFPGEFNFHFVADIRDIEKLDVTVFARQIELSGSVSGTLVHSREQSGTFTAEEPVSFLTYIERAIDA